MTQPDHDFVAAADAVMRDLFTRLCEFDPDEVDCDLAMGVLTMQFADGKKFVLNRQSAASQIWLAHGVSAYHFARDPQTGRWLDTKGRGELRELLARAIGEKLGRPVSLP
ncbi:MAG TPA: iron donor protein CyaY [Planctomycetota bacterium]|nr:iron donor protein CyaY [Planctomycetota bacterium]